MGKTDKYKSRIKVGSVEWRMEREAEGSKRNIRLEVRKCRRTVLQMSSSELGPHTLPLPWASPSRRCLGHIRASFFHPPRGASTQNKVTSQGV